ncbi:hypothetical protein MAR_019742 [Mya arenaria]|uniref:Uncharacterized protein n=1 Tax=Mya arenaria TaxID=6604 RepID=A0ABY7E6F8_MYAAR|nr:hypothetical protein MAR_019742 [Mya arenaria]
MYVYEVLYWSNSALSTLAPTPIATTSTPELCNSLASLTAISALFVPPSVTSTTTSCALGLFPWADVRTELRTSQKAALVAVLPRTYGMFSEAIPLDPRAVAVLNQTHQGIVRTNAQIVDDGGDKVPEEQMV